MADEHAPQHDFVRVVHVPHGDRAILIFLNKIIKRKIIENIKLFNLAARDHHAVLEAQMQHRLAVVHQRVVQLAVEAPHPEYQVLLK